MSSHHKSFCNSTINDETKVKTQAHTQTILYVYDPHPRRSLYSRGIKLRKPCVASSRQKQIVQQKNFFKAQFKTQTCHGLWKVELQNNASCWLHETWHINFHFQLGIFDYGILLIIISLIFKHIHLSTTKWANFWKYLYQINKIFGVFWIQF